MPPAAIAAAAIGSSVIGGVMSSGASSSAANAQAAASNHAADLQEANYQQTRNDLSPYFNAGGALVGGAGALFGASYGNPLLAPPASPGVTTAGPPVPRPPLTASSQAVQDLAGQLTPSIAAAIQGGAASGSLAGGYTFQQTPASGPTYADGGAGEGTVEQTSAGSPASFQLIDPNGNVVGTFGDTADQAGGIANALALGYGNAQQAAMAGQPSTQTTGASPGPPTLIGLNDSQYGIPALGETNFVNAMGANNISDLAFKPAEGNDFYKAMGVNGPADLAWNPTQAQLENLPGYQFELQQGEQATQNSAAAKGLGVSGAAMKAAAGYAQGLASTDLNTYYNQWMGNLQNQQNEFSKNYNDQLTGWNNNLAQLSSVFNNNLINRFNMNQGAVQGAYNRMAGLIGTGENAAAQSGSIGQAGAASAGSNIVGAGNAQASGIMGSNNALVQGLNGVAQAPITSALYSQLGNGGLGGGATNANSGYGYMAPNASITSSSGYGNF